MAAHLAQMRENQVVQFHGGKITDRYTFCAQLGRALRMKHVRGVIEGPGGIVHALRRSLESASFKRRYLIWHDAHVLLREDPPLFSRLVDALAGVCAESEYVSEDRLVIQRLVFIGAASLDVYAENPRAQFQAWYSERGEKPLWRCITGLRRPPFLRYEIDRSQIVLRDAPVRLEVAARTKRPATRG
ncbi:MAG: hypothetical protein AB7G11_08595 [Phycisphaerales bacterium]